MPLRLDLRGNELPPELKLRSVGVTIQYGQMRIGQAESWLPVRSELLALETTGRENRNVTSFEACRQYASVSNVQFDPVESPTDISGPAAITLLPGVMIEGRLRDLIDRATAARGEVVYATVAADVKRSGLVIVPKGAVLTGRILWIETRAVRSAVYWSVGLLFHTIEFGGKRGEFRGELEAAGTGMDDFIRRQERSGENFLYLGAKTTRLQAGMRLVLRTK